MKVENGELNRAKGELIREANKVENGKLNRARGELMSKANKVESGKTSLLWAWCLLLMHSWFAKCFIRD